MFGFGLSSSFLSSDPATQLWKDIQNAVSGNIYSHFEVWGVGARPIFRLDNYTFPLWRFVKDRNRTPFRGPNGSGEVFAIYEMCDRITS